MSAWWEVPGGHINVDVLKQDASLLLASLKRLLGPNPGSDDRDAAWAAVEKAESR